MKICKILKKQKKCRTDLRLILWDPVTYLVDISAGWAFSHVGKLARSQSVQRCCMSIVCSSTLKYITPLLRFVVNPQHIERVQFRFYTSIDASITIADVDKQWSVLSSAPPGRRPVRQFFDHPASQQRANVRFRRESLVSIFTVKIISKSLIWSVVSVQGRYQPKFLATFDVRYCVLKPIRCSAGAAMATDIEENQTKL